MSIVELLNNSTDEPEDRIGLYYGGWDGSHGTPATMRTANIGLATWRIDGFGSVSNGGDRAGIVTTKPIVFTAMNST